MHARLAAAVLTLTCTLAAAEAPPSAEEQARFLDSARKVALAYTDTLPDFICDEVIYRYRLSGSNWALLDRLTARLTYFDKKENYTLTSGNSEQPLETTSGAVTRGEFGNTLATLFDPRSETGFRWLRAAQAHGVAVWEFSYLLPAARANQALYFGKLSDDHSASVGLRGVVQIARENSMVTKLEVETTEVPSAFPIKSGRQVIEYANADVGGRKYYLPSRADSTMEVATTGSRSSRSGPSTTKFRNFVEFRTYRKFNVETKLTFAGDEAEPLRRP